MNLTVELTTDQVVSFVQQMPPEAQQALLLTIAEQAAANKDSRMARTEIQFRRLCAARGMDWDTMSEAERENFVDDLVHEDARMQSIVVYDTEYFALRARLEGRPVSLC